MQDLWVHKSSARRVNKRMTWQTHDRLSWRHIGATRSLIVFMPPGHTKTLSDVQIAALGPGAQTIAAAVSA